MAISHKPCIRVLHHGVDVTGACIEAAWGSNSRLQTYAIIRQETGELETITDDLEFFIVATPPTAVEEKPEPLNYETFFFLRSGRFYSLWGSKD